MECSTCLVVVLVGRESLPVDGVGLVGFSKGCSSLSRVPYCSTC